MTRSAIRKTVGIISCEDAKKAGATRYFTGLACCNGHVAERRTCDWKCVACNNERKKEAARNKRARDPEKGRVACRKWRANHPDRMMAAVTAWKDRNKEKELEGKRRRWGRAADKYSERRRKKYAENPEIFRLRVRKWNSNNPEKVAAIGRSKHAKRRGAPGVHTAADVLAIFKMQKCRCAYCSVSLKDRTYHVDHIKPLSRGGHNDRTNLQILCPTCNMRKYNKDPISFARSLGKLL